MWMSLMNSILAYQISLETNESTRNLTHSMIGIQTTNISRQTLLHKTPCGVVRSIYKYRRLRSGGRK